MIEIELSGSVWSSPGKEDNVLNKFDNVSSPGRSLKRKY